jgi:hydroxypyruvate reductase
MKSSGAMNNILRRQARQIFDEALRAADPEEAVERHLRTIDFDLFQRIFVLGAGKAGASMAHAAERVLGNRITAGRVNVKDGHVAELARISLQEARHPLPDERGVAGSERIAALAESAGVGDLVLCLISGGGSALMPLPAAGITLAEKQEVTRLLLACGADIREINTLRKHLSRIKGGQLARMAAPATVEALLLSDVIGDDLSVIGSGPTAPDGSTFADCAAIVDRYGLRPRLPEAVRLRLEGGARGEIAETPKAGDRLFERVRNTIVGGNRLALNRAAACAQGLGFRTLVLASTIQGETRDVARMHAAIAREVVEYGSPVAPPAAIISGGETTVTLRGNGLGGRNQEFVLAAAIDIAGLPDVIVFSAGTDGTDGPTDAAGALADGDTLARNPAAAAFLERNDSYAYFAPLGDLVITGPTNTNVMDVHILLIGAPA